MSKLKGRPLRAEEADELLKHWAIPDVAPNEKSFGNRSTAYGTPLSELYKKELAEEMPADEPEEPELPKLTMVELERIRQDAYEEGLKQGHEQGYIDGFEKALVREKKLVTKKVLSWVKPKAKKRLNL